MSTKPEKKDRLVGVTLGSYKLTEVLASGGMARIYRGVDVNLERQVAVKVLKQDGPVVDDTMKIRFEREARAIATLDHPNIIPVYAFDKYDDDGEEIFYLAMKFVEGTDLARELQNLRRRSERMDVKRALHILEQVASALDHAHQKGVIHRDIKPSNIMLDANDQAILTDFGLVLRTTDNTMGTAFGTPRYIAPEQAVASEKAVAQSDLYSLAVILYEIVTGQTPFTGDTPMEIALSHVSEPPPPPTTIDPTIPRGVEAEILKSLSKKPEDRHRSASEFVAAVKKAYEQAAQASTNATTPVKPDAPKAPVPPKPAEVRSAPVPTPAVSMTPISKPGEAKPASPAPAPRMVTLGGMTLPLLPVIAGGVILLVLVVALVLSISGGGGSAAVDTSGTATSDAATAIALGFTPLPPSPTTYPSIVTLIYDDAILIIRNDTQSALNVAGFTLTRGTDTFSGGDMPQDTLPVGRCYILTIAGRSSTSSIEVAGRNRPVPLVDLCSNVTHGRATVPASRVSTLFWLGSGEFEAKNGSTRLATCQPAARGSVGTCTFRWSE